LSNRFGIVHRTVSYIGLRQISCHVTDLAKAPLAKGPRPPPQSWQTTNKSTKRDLAKEIKNRHKTSEELKRQQTTKYLVIACALGIVTFVTSPFWAPTTGRTNANFGVVNAQITSAREEYKLGISEDELLRQRIEEKAARSNTEGELKWQKRQEKLRGFGETLTAEEEALGRVLDSREEDSRTLGQIKADIAKKSADTETWKRLNRETEEGKARA